MSDPTSKTLEVRRRAVEVLSLLRPVSALGGRLTRLGEDCDGGYIVLDDLRAEQPIYSLGVGPRCSFDLALAERGHQVFMYDHTVDGPGTSHPNFHFFKQAIDAADGSLANIIARNGHQDRCDLFMQMDIERAEYHVIPATPQRVLEQFRQIVVELHWLPDVVYDDMYGRIAATVAALRRSHNVVHVHANNYAAPVDVGGILVPATVEVTLVRRRDYWFTPCMKLFPTTLDRANDPATPDIVLGRIGVKPTRKWCTATVPLVSEWLARL